MKAGRFSHFVSELATDPELCEAINSFTAYRHTPHGWLANDNGSVQDASLEDRLNKTISGPDHWREPNSCTTYFPIPALDAVIAIVFDAPPKKQTQNVISSLLRRCLQHALNAYDANHDSLTALFTHRHLEEYAISVLSEQTKTSTTVSEPLDSMLASPAFCMLTLDIDHFKQINDSYGHDYGDIVLRCFASRIDGALDRIMADASQRLTLRPARSGGEEFLVAAFGSLTTETVRGIADTLRRCIAEEVLPDEPEWIKHKGESHSPLPHVSERNVKVSIGVSSIAQLTKRTTPRALFATMRKESDAALYRAKSGGRNAIRYFPDIKARYGRVLEHHSGTNVVAIDLGKNDGVSVGNEFLVYHPDFTGESAFVYSDGRTKRRLGVYPRDACGRLVVFDAQSEIAFCRVTLQRHTAAFLAMSLLEAVSVGSISHLITSDASLGETDISPFASVEEIDAFIKASASPKESPCVAVFGLRDIQALETARGAAFVNHALAKLYYAIRDCFPATRAIAQIVPGQVVAATRVDSSYNPEEVITNTIANAEAQCAAGVQFVAGAFAEARFKPSSLGGDKSIMKSEYALQYARYAAAVDFEIDKVHFFTPYTAGSLVGDARRSGKNKDGMADYNVFKEMGIANAIVENNAALIAYCSEEQDLELALRCIDASIELEEDDTAMCNKGLILFASGRPKEAFQAFCRARQLEEDGVVSPVYQRTEALAAWRTFQEDSSLVERERVKKLLVASRECPTPIGSQITRSTIEAAIKAIEDHSEATKSAP